MVKGKVLRGHPPSNPPFLQKYPSERKVTLTQTAMYPCGVPRMEVVSWVMESASRNVATVACLERSGGHV